MRQILAVLACLATLNVPLAAHAFSNEAEITGFVTSYYKHPDPGRVPEVILSASRMRAFRDGRGAPPFFGFLAGALGRDPSLASVLPDLARKLPQSDQPILVLGAWYSGLEDTRKLLADLEKLMPAQKGPIENFLKSPSLVRLTDVPLGQGPWVIDALWGVFMATGDEAPVIRVVQALPWLDLQGDTQKTMIGNAAKWSLTSNASQHPRVLEILKAQAAKQPDVAAALSEVIADAEREIATPRQQQAPPAARPQVPPPPRRQIPPPPS